ncbi:MAG: hypothetical protein LKG19_08085 [Saprospiraceae bacterium]|jgi:hypothetical protein|nr:hypothetical protein [Saprospiraceae bacterium]
MTIITLEEYISRYYIDTLPYAYASEQIINSVIFKKALGLPNPTTNNSKTN